MITKLTNVRSRKRRRKSFRFMFVPSGSRRLGLGVNQRLRVNAFSEPYAAPPGLVHRRLPRNSPYIAADNARQGEWTLDRGLPRWREDLQSAKTSSPASCIWRGGSRAGVAGRLDLEGGGSCPELHARTSKPRRAPAAERTC